MKMIERMNNYLIDKEYKIIIKEKEVNIINYSEIIDFSLDKISIRYNKKNITIEGKSLYIFKMVENEVLIKGDIMIVRIN